MDGTSAGQAATTTSSSLVSENPTVKDNLRPYNGPDTEKEASSLLFGEDWESEKTLVAALSSLQRMEAKIHQLRTLLPGRLLSPVAPIIDPNVAREQNFKSKSPQEMCQHLSGTAREAVTEVEAFKQEWGNPEMKAIWNKVDKKLAESGGEYPQPTGRWERDYDIVLKQLDEEDKRENELRIDHEEEQEKARQATIHGGWRSIIETFIQKTDYDKVAINITRPENNTGRFSALLRRIGVLLYVQQTQEFENQSFGEWQVLHVSRKSITTLESDILNHINARPRKWDLLYLLGMLSSYADLKETRCAKCNRLADKTAQLPTTRKYEPTKDTGKETFTWNAYHSGCL